MTVGYIKEPHTTKFTSCAKCGKTHLVLDLMEREYNNILSILLSSAQKFEIIRHIIPKSGSKMMIKFGLLNLKISSSCGLGVVAVFKTLQNTIYY